MGEVLGPCWVKGIGSLCDLDVADDRHRRRTEELEHNGFAVGRTLRGEVPVAASNDMEIPVFDPSCPFVGMPSLGPIPEQAPDVRVDP